MVASEQEFILASCCGSPMSKNSVLEELILHEVCIDFTKFVVNSSNHDGMSKGSAIILDF